jgi:hypothetical protein
VVKSPPTHVPVSGNKLVRMRWWGVRFVAVLSRVMSVLNWSGGGTAELGTANKRDSVTLPNVASINWVRLIRRQTVRAVLRFHPPRWVSVAASIACTSTHGMVV